MLPDGRVSYYQAMWAIALVVAGCAAWQPPAPVGPVFRVVVPGDLDCTKTAAELERILAEAETAKASRVIVELGGNASREHVVHRMAAALRACEIDTEAWVADARDRAVGMGQLVVAQFADKVVADRRITVNGGAVRPAPTETPASKARDGELREWLAAVLEGREAIAGMRELLLGPVVECRLAGEPPALVFGPMELSVRAAVTSTQLTAAKAGVLEWAVPGAALETLRVAGTPKSWPPRPPPRATERRIVATAASELRAARDLVDEIDRAITSAEQALNLPDPSERNIARSKFRDAAKWAASELSLATRDVATLATLLEDSPEVAEVPAPGQGEGATAAACAARWRSVVSSRRDRAERTRLKAERFAAIRD